MKNLVLIIFAVLICSCGKDDITGPTGTGSTDSLIYSKDSVTAVSELGMTLPTIVNIDSLHTNKYKIVFDASTNDTTTRPVVEILYYFFQDSVHALYEEEFTGEQINQHYDKTILINEIHDFKLEIDAGFTAIYSGSWITIKHLKIYIVH
jgi:hypothetical protein